VEQGYKQVKDELGWADFQVRSDRVIRRHWTLVCCAFSFCWHAGHAQAAPAAGPAALPAATGATPAQAAARGAQQRLDPDRRHRAGRHRGVVAAGAAAGARLAGPWVWLQRRWRGWSTSPPPLPLQQALDRVRNGRPIYRYLPP
jgi:fermentation-respiration switch protein FrsA (DUF1100 family)